MRLVTKAIVLRETAYKESDKILTLLTKERGKLTATARGSRKKGGGVSAACQLLVWSEMTLSEYRGRWTVVEGETLLEFRRVRSDLERLTMGSYFAELLELLTEEGVPDEEELDLLLTALHVMETTDRPLPLVKATFELAILRMAGYCPRLDACDICGGEPVDPRLVPREGVVCCGKCVSYLGGKPTLPLDRGSLAAMRYVVDTPTRRAFSYRLGEASLRLMSCAIERFLMEQLERGFYTLEFYHELTGQAAPPDAGTAPAETEG